MGQRPKKIFFPEHTNGQQAHENKLNITNCHGNQNQNHNEISLHPCQNGCHQKHRRKQVLARMGRKGSP